MEIINLKGETMEKSKVYFTKEITPESLIKIYQALGRELKGNVAVKISTGEPGGHDYGEVMSEGALKLLKENNIQADYKTLTPNIINRKGDDICPMEKAVKDCNDFEEAYILLQYKLKEIKTNMQATKII